MKSQSTCNIFNFYEFINESFKESILIENPLQLRGYGVPDGIIEQMKEWDIIYKSPFSSSFYNSSEITWEYKPDKSFRVSDHWNFTTRGRTHCQTVEQAPNQKYFSIGQYDASIDKYHLLYSELSVKAQRKAEAAKKLKEYLSSPETLEKIKSLQDLISQEKVGIQVDYKFSGYGGILKEFGGQGKDLIIVKKGDTSKVVHACKPFTYQHDSKLKLYNLETGENIEDPYKLPKDTH